MAVYEVNGSRYELPDDLEGQQLDGVLNEIAQMDQQGDQGTAQQGGYQKPPKDIDPATLAGNADWLKATREVYRFDKGQDFAGSDQDLSEWGLNAMGDFNYNLVSMGVDAGRLANSATPQEKAAFLHMMDTYDNLNMSWGGAARFAKGVATDPLTYVGLSTFGVGLAGKEGAKQVTKAGLKELLKVGMKAGSVAGAEGAIYGATDNTIRQSVEVAAGRREEIDGWDQMKAAGLGAGLGFAGGTAVSAIASSVAQKWRSRIMENTLPKPGRASGSVTKERVEPTLGITSKVDDTAQQSAQPEGATPEVHPQADPLKLTAPEAVSKDPAGATGGGELAPRAATADDVIFGRTLDDLRSPPQDNTIPFEPRNMEEVTAFAKRLGEDIRDLHYTEVEDIVDQLRSTQMTQVEWGSFNRSTQIAVDHIRGELADTIKSLQATKDPQKIAQLAQRQGELENLLAPVATVDEAFSSLTGSMLRQRQEGMTALRGQSPESVRAESMNTSNPLSKEEADLEFARRVDQAMESREVKEKVRDYDNQIQMALNRGDTAEAARLIAVKQEDIGQEVLGLTGADASFMNKLNEYIISNVFSTTTIAVNVVPSMAKILYRPALNALLSNPAEKAVRQEMAATYTAMASAVRGALGASMEAFRFEQSLLSRDPNRLLEGQMAIKGKKGGIIRLFPRLLTATDEFMSRLTYDGYIAGQRAAAAYAEGEAKGLTGDALKSYAQAEVKKAVEAAYSPKGSAEDLQVIITKGRALGLTGKELADYARDQAAKNPKHLQHGLNEEALDYTRDALYKRAFSGEGFASDVAKTVEEHVHRQPVWKLLGQLFFRTPIRVFEEGIRMTPGVQLLAPGFMADLAGKNGRKGQLRAQGEAMMSLAIAGQVLSLYAQGRITGDGAYSDWRQQRGRTDSDLPEPYTIRFADGSTWSYRNFDPLATPVKIIINGLERYERLSMRERQGEFINGDDWGRAEAAVHVGLGAITQAIRDANLMAGGETLLKALEGMGDKEDATLVKLAGEKLRTLVPNTLHKIARTNDPTMDDPATFWQMVETRVLGFAGTDAEKRNSAKSYDVLGNVRQSNSTDGLWNIFAMVSEEERGKGRSEKELFVLRKLDELSQQTGASFFLSPLDPQLGDLRTQRTADGKETQWDRLVRYYREFNPTDGLYMILASGLPVGTMETNGPMVTEAQKYIGQVREAARYKLIMDEVEALDRYRNSLTREAQTQAGFWDRKR